MIYFDNAATTFPKPKSVIRAVNECLNKYCGNPGRSSHSLSLRASEEIYEAREKIAEFLGADRAERVVFTYNATHALNLAIKTVITEKCHVITSDVEHNSVIRPLEKLRRTLGIEYSCFDTDKELSGELERIVREDTKCIVSTVASNVTGKNTDIKALSDFSRKKNIPLILDASQALGHEPFDLNLTPCTVLCAPGHKSLFGIQGSGIAVFSDDTLRDSFIEGGSGSESIKVEMPARLPERYEAGTPSVPSIIALKAGIDFINKVGIDSIKEKTDQIRLEIIDRLSSLDRISFITGAGAIISFGIRDVPSSKISEMLDDVGICTRSGLHCSPSAHKKLGSLDYGTVRISLSCFNTKKEADMLYKAMKDILPRV